MEALAGLLLMAVVGRLIYRSAYDAFTNFRSIYFKIPSEVPPYTGQNFVFGVTGQHLVKKLFWPLLAIIAGSMIFKMEAVWVFALFFGLPLLIRIVEPLIHMSDKIVITASSVYFSLFRKKLTIDWRSVTHIELRYSYYRSKGLTLYPILIFYSNTKTEEVKLSGIFFREKSREIFMTLKNLFPEKTFILGWNDTKTTTIEKLVIQQGHASLKPTNPDIVEEIKTVLDVQPLSQRSVKLFYIPISVGVVGGLIALIFIPNVLGFLGGLFIAFGVYALVVGEILMNTGVVKGLNARVIGIGLAVGGLAFLFLVQTS
jgi:hypothetical protein